MKKGCATEKCMITIGFAAAFMMIVLMLLEVSGKSKQQQDYLERQQDYLERQQDYIVIERDYEGDILLDPESRTRYLRTDEGMYEMEEEKLQ